MASTTSDEEKYNWEEEDEKDGGRGDSDEEKEDGKESKSRESQRKKKISGTELLNRVQKYFYEDEEFTRTFENFVKEECSIIDLGSEEYKLEYTEAYERYKILFEDKLETFIENQGCTSLDFYKALKDTSDNDSESTHAIFGQILVAVVDFDIFMVMMREMAQSNSRASRK